ncbi:MAG: hypothetical protein JXR48_02910 [Candidatus Delongbacteria bacterium]|nr:hypothetical protein [Candidatus Delongbacteria bacterium]MBN2833898.1 hypothetical protein [Candidatus Delongbacteria bacterium]
MYAIKNISNGLRFIFVIIISALFFTSCEEDNKVSSSEDLYYKINNPALNSVFSVSSLIDFECESNGEYTDIDSVQFYIGDVLIYTELNSLLSPLKICYESDNLEIGKHTFSSKLFTKNNGVLEASIDFVMIENQPPSINFIQNFDDSLSYSDTFVLNLATTVSDPEDKIDHVDFFMDSEKLHTVYEAPYIFTLELDNNFGVKKLISKVTDGSGLTDSDTLEVLFNSYPQILNFTIHEDIVYLKNETTIIDYSFTDLEGGINAVLYFDDEPVFSTDDLSGNFNLDLSSYTTGEHSAELEVYDETGALTKKDYDVYIASEKIIISYDDCESIDDLSWNTHTFAGQYSPATNLWDVDSTYSNSGNFSINQSPGKYYHDYDYSLWKDQEISDGDIYINLKFYLKYDIFEMHNIELVYYYFYYGYNSTSVGTIFGPNEDFELKSYVIKLEELSGIDEIRLAIRLDALPEFDEIYKGMWIDDIELSIYR